MDKYINIASELNCDFSAHCLWANAPTDGLFDNSNFYLFQKNDDRSFPIQVGPGNAHPQTGFLNDYLIVFLILSKINIL